MKLVDAKPRMTVDSYLNELAVLLKVDRTLLSVRQYWSGKPSTITETYQVTDAVTTEVVLSHDPPLESVVTSFKLIKFPGCCAFAISTEAFVRPEFQNKGVNTLTNLLRQEIAKRALNVTTLICTDREDNLPERRTLAKLGWKDIYQVVNRSTGNLVNISIKEL